jgi:hypothetical protein
VPSPLTSREFRPKLADFGIAYLIDATRITSPGTLIGTAAYLSPEQAHGDPLTAASDIYSLGLVLLESLTGKRPFTGSAIEVTLARLLRDPEVSASLGSGWSALLGSMTQREPEERPSALEVAESARKLIDPRRDGPPTAIVVPDVPLTAARTQLLDATAEATAVYPVPEHGTAATTLLPAETAAAPVAPTASATATTALRREPERRRGPNPWLLVLVLALVAIAVGLAVVLLGGDQQTPLPAVDGELGEHLQRLRESIRP